MEIAFVVYLGVGCFWAFILLIFNIMEYGVNGEFNPRMARLFFAAVVWPLVVLGALLFVRVMGARAAWPEEWAGAWKDYRAKRKNKARRETDY